MQRLGIVWVQDTSLCPASSLLSHCCSLLLSFFTIRMLSIAGKAVLTPRDSVSSAAAPPPLPAAEVPGMGTVVVLVATLVLATTEIDIRD